MVEKKRENNDYQYSLDDILAEFGEVTTPKKDVGVFSLPEDTPAIWEDIITPIMPTPLQGKIDKEIVALKDVPPPPVSPPVIDDVKIAKPLATKPRKIVVDPEFGEYDDDYEDAPKKPKKKKLKNKINEPTKKNIEIKPYDIIFSPREDFSASAKLCSKKIISYSVLVLFSVIFTALCTYLNLATYATTLPLPAIILENRTLLFYLVLLFQSLSMLCGMELLISGVYKLFTLSPTLDSVVAVNSLVIFVHGLLSVTGVVPDSVPFSAVSCFSILLAIVSKRYKLIVLKRGYSVAQVASAPIGVTLKNNKSGLVASKIKSGADVDYADICAPNPNERLSLIYAPMLLILPIIFSVLACYKTEDFSGFMWAYAALSSISVPFGLYSAYALPALRSGKKMFTSGSFIVDSGALKYFSKTKSIVLTDGDIFPNGSVEITSMKVVGSSQIETVLSYATALFEHSGGGAYKAFSDLSRMRFVLPKKATQIQIYESGGISGLIGSDNVLIGNASFVMRMGINITHGINIKNSIFLAINSVVCGVFSLAYSEIPQTHSAWHTLKGFKITPILASLDFNVTPMLVERTFDLSSSYLFYPEVSERQAYANPDTSAHAPSVAFLSRDTMQSLCEVVAGGRKLYRSMRFNIVISLLSSFFGLSLMYFLVSGGYDYVASAYNVLLFLALWYIPILLSCFFSNKF